VIWPSLYKRQRRIILAAGMIAVQGRIQREGEVVHFVANHWSDLSADLAGVGDRDNGFRCRTDMATNSVTAVPASIRVACRRRGRGRATLRTNPEHELQRSPNRPWSARGS
jgi:hypothetical protein